LSKVLGKNKSKRVMWGADLRPCRHTNFFIGAWQNGLEDARKESVVVEEEGVGCDKQGIRSQLIKKKKKREFPHPSPTGHLGSSKGGGGRRECWSTSLTGCEEDGRARRWGERRDARERGSRVYAAQGECGKTQNKNVLLQN